MKSLVKCSYSRLCIALLSACLGFCEAQNNEGPKKAPSSKEEGQSSGETKKAPASKEKGQAPRPIVYHLHIKGAITPAALESFEKAIELSEKDASTKAVAALLLTLDTPGGLVSSMDDIIRRILNAAIPVLTYVSPRGAACGSAGVFILYASHIAAMAPATNIGSATPVSVGGGGVSKDDSKKGQQDRIPKTAGANDALNMKRKILNHARAQIRSLAQYHGRNASFAEATITQAKNISAREALRIKAIDILAPSKEALLEQAHGRKVRMPSGTLKLELKGAKIQSLHKDFRQKMLDLIANPNLAYLLMMLGILGLLAELQNPGLIFPGVLGSISLFLGLYAMQSIALSHTGFALLGLAFIFFVLEIYVFSYGLLSVAGLFSMLVGSLMLARSGAAFSSLSMQLALSISIVVSVLAAAMIYAAAKSQRRSTMRQSGYAKLMTARALSRIQIDSQSGSVEALGEIWQARSQGGEIIAPQKQVRIKDRIGMLLFVEELDKQDKDSAV